MATIKHLGEALAHAVGMRSRAVAFAADDLHRHGLIGAPEDDATWQDAGRLLIGTLGGLDASAPHRVVEAFAGLPLCRVEKIDNGPDAVSWKILPADHRVYDDMRIGLGPTFGTAIATCVRDYSRESALTVAPGMIKLVTGPGETRAVFALHVTTEPIVAMLTCRSMHSPDAAYPEAYPDRVVEIPETIWPVLRRVLANNDTLPGPAHWCTELQPVDESPGELREI